MGRFIRIGLAVALLVVGAVACGGGTSSPDKLTIVGSGS
jgi:hypothetical protein